MAFAFGEEIHFHGLKKTNINDYNLLPNQFYYRIFSIHLWSRSIFHTFIIWLSPYLRLPPGTGEYAGAWHHPSRYLKRLHVRELPFSLLCCYEGSSGSWHLLQSPGRPKISARTSSRTPHQHCIRPISILSARCPFFSGDTDRTRRRICFPCYRQPWRCTSLRHWRSHTWTPPLCSLQHDAT